MSTRPRILVGLDGSPLAESILASVRTIALALEAEIVLVHVTAVPERAVAAEVTVDLDEVVAQERRSAARYLERVAADLGRRGLTARTLTLVGDAAAEIVRSAAHEHAELVALATHGRSGMQRWLHGSVADAVLHTATTPLLLLRPHQDGAAVAPQPRAVLVPLDGSVLAETVLPVAARLARALRVPLRLLRVVEVATLTFAGDPFGSVYTDYDRVLALLRAAAEDYLRGIAARLGGAAAGVETAVTCGTAVDAIVADARRGGALVALGSHGRSGWRAVALGSVARRVVLLADGPVLVVRSAPPSTTSA